MLCILADDLTGAFDAAGPFAQRGQTVAVALHPYAVAQAVATGCDVVAVSTRSREIPASEAAARVAAVRAALPPMVRIFKKVDSRLKGNIAAELAALQPSRLFVAPAIPAFGRIVRDGLVSGFGIDTPLSVAAALGDFAGMAIVPDVSTVAEMLGALRTAPEGALLVGARGLAEALATEITGRGASPFAQPRISRLLMVIGSRDPITTAQVAALRRQDGVEWRDAPNGSLGSHGPLQGVTVVQVTPGAFPVEPHAVHAALAGSVHPKLTAQADGLFLTGGATAEAVLQRMALDVLQLDGEVLPGVPLASADGRLIILKSGGFGAEDCLVEVARKLQATP